MSDVVDALGEGWSARPPIERASYERGAGSMPFSRSPSPPPTSEIKLGFTDWRTPPVVTVRKLSSGDVLPHSLPVQPIWDNTSKWSVMRQKLFCMDDDWDWTDVEKKDGERYVVTLSPSVWAFQLHNYACIFCPAMAQNWPSEAKETHRSIQTLIECLKQLETDAAE